MTASVASGTAPRPPDLSVLVCTYECEAFIVECLDAVVANTPGHRLEIIVADNDSGDATVAVVRAAHPDVTVIEMGRNAGFAAANNAALAVAGGRHVILLNPDTVVQPGALDTMIEALDARADVGIVAPQLLNTDGTDQGTARSFPTPAAAVFGRRSPLTKLFPRNRWSSRFLLGRDHVGDEPFPVDWVSGACLMARRDDAVALGGLDEGFFMHFEDTDFCHRMKDRGLGVLCVPRARVLHHEGGSRRGWPADQVRHFHYGAYRYWTTHHAPQRWNPLRLVVAVLLATRAALVIAGNRVRHGDTTATSTATTTSPPPATTANSAATPTTGPPAPAAPAAPDQREPITTGMNA